MKNEQEVLKKVQDLLEKNKELMFEGDYDSADMGVYHWVMKNAPEVYHLSEEKIHPEMGKAYACGYDGEPYENPFKERSLMWWLCEQSAGQGHMDS